MADNLDLSSLQEEIAEEIRMLFEALGEAKEQAAGGDVQAAQTVPLLGKNIQDTVALFRGLNDVLAKERGDRQKDAREKEQVNRGILRGTRDAAESVAGFGRSMMGLPSTFADLIKKSVGGTGDHGIMSTLQKSLTLAILPLGKLFIPAIAWASKRLQDLAAVMPDLINKVKTFGQASIFGGLGLTSKFGDSDFKERAEAMRQKSERVGRNVREEEAVVRAQQGLPQLPQQNWPRFDPKGLLAAQQEKSYRERVAGMSKEELDTELKRIRKERAAMDLRPITATAGWKRDPVTGLLVPDPTAGGNKTPKGEGGEGPGARGGKGYLSDILPMGYKAQYSDIADIREQMQIAAFSQTEMDREIWKQMRDLQMQMLDEMKKGNNKTDLPRR